eukprot:1142245-Pelagomonas_calceolata.AAC.4
MLVAVQVSYVLEELVLSLCDTTFQHLTDIEVAEGVSIVKWQQAYLAAMAAVPVPVPVRVPVPVCVPAHVP